MHTRIALAAVTIATASMLVTIAHQAMATRAGERLLSCREAARLAHAEGFRSIEALSCTAPYDFSASRDNCSFAIRVTAQGRSTAVETSCDSDATEVMDRPIVPLRTCPSCS
jgi:predicted hotdog family 3-hydroxylacyl-ACP dehydratase